ncbi:serine/threonine protein kinase [Planctomycetota bacterium]
MVHEIDLTGVTISHFELIEKIGSGGMGTVYLARDTQTDKDVAVKVLPPRLEDTPERIDHFLEEAHVSIQLDHPNITKGLEVGEYEGVYYFAKEYIKGWTLEQALKEHGAFREEAIIQIGLQMALALEESDKASLVHKDIKPSNILMTMSNIAYITDFGLASFIRIPEHEGEKDLLVAGTPHYMSPEQAAGHTDLDIRSDIYSLGVTFYEMATGEIPYRAESTKEIMGKHIFAPVADPRNKNPEVSDKLAAVIVKMMAKDRSDRYNSPGELQKEFYNLIQGKELIAEKEAREKEKEEKARKISSVVFGYFKKVCEKIFPKKVAAFLVSFKVIVISMALVIVGLTVMVVFLVVQVFSINGNEKDNAGEQNEAGKEQVFEEIKTLPAAIGKPSGKSIIHYAFTEDFARTVKTGEQVSSQNDLCVSTVPAANGSPRTSRLELSLDCGLEPNTSYIMWFTVRAGQEGTVIMEALTESGLTYSFAGHLPESVILRQIRLNTSSFKKCNDESVNLQNTTTPVKLTSLKVCFTSLTDDYPQNCLLINEFAVIKE